MDINRRRRIHFNALRRGKQFNQHLQASFAQHGDACFEFHVLEVVPEELRERETHGTKE